MDPDTAATPHHDLIAALIRSTALIQDTCATASSEHGLTPQQAQLMCVVGDKPSSMVRLGALLRVGKSSMTGLIQRAEEAGLVRRAPDPEDGRSTLIELTEAGRRANTAFRATVGERITRMIGTLPPDEQKALSMALSTIVTNNDAPQTWPPEEEHR